MACDILDFQCIFVSELIGNPLLATVMLMIFYFVATAKLDFDFDTTLVLAIPISLMIAFSMGGFPTLFAVITMIVAVTITWIWQRAIGNR